ncbi:MAG: ArsR family transcriptional regulator [Methanobacteriota archaeon]|nr:MAG: ArsR family transcriptional regulator [Euryarchaeota archaeon]
MPKETKLVTKDHTLVDLLIEAGVPKNIAKTLVCLTKKEETTSVEIEKATGLRQPEVSIAMQNLRKRKWVEKRDIKKEGKGRPVHSYQLSLSLEEIVNVLEKDAKAKIAKIEQNITQIRRHLK